MLWIILDNFLNDSCCGIVYFFYQMLDVISQGHAAMRRCAEKVCIVFVMRRGIILDHAIALRLLERA